MSGAPDFDPTYRVALWLPPMETRKALIDVALKAAGQIGEIAAKALAWDISAALDEVERTYGVKAERSPA